MSAPAHAVITAGGTVDGDFAVALGSPVKSLGRIGGRAMLDVGLDACAGAGIAGVAVIGGPEVRAHLAPRGVRVIDAAADGGTNVLRALAAWPGRSFVYLTSDLPFATAAGLRDLMKRSAPYGVAMGLCDALAYEARFPAAPPAGVALRGERVVNAGAFVFTAEGADRARAFAARFFDARKSPVGMARLLGPALLLRFATRRLGVDDVVAYASRRLALAVGAVRDCDAGLCYDVDDLAEYRYACARAEPER